MHGWWIWPRLYVYDIQQQCVVFLYDTLVDKMTNKYEISGPGVGGRAGVGAVGPPGLKGHFSADYSSANILNMIRLWNKID